MSAVTIEAVGVELGDKVICGWCKATFSTRGKLCRRRTGMLCPGRQAIAGTWAQIEQREQPQTTGRG